MREKEDQIVRECILYSYMQCWLTTNDGWNFLTEIKRIRSHDAAVSKSVEGTADTANISTLCANNIANFILCSV